MARAQKVAEETELPIDPVTETVTYVPGPMDPSQVAWAGHTFHANVAKEIRGHAAGTEREKLNASLIESARVNPRFTVGGAKPKRNAAKEPTTPEEYRAYFVEWMNQPFQNAEPGKCADGLIARLAKDRDLQVACGVGTDDFEFMGTLFMPKVHELAKMDELTEAQLGAVWMRHGYNTLPW